MHNLIFRRLLSLFLSIIKKRSLMCMSKCVRLFGSQRTIFCDDISKTVRYEYFKFSMQVTHFGESKIGSDLIHLQFSVSQTTNYFFIRTPNMFNGCCRNDNIDRYISKYLDPLEIYILFIFFQKNFFVLLLLPSRIFCIKFLFEQIYIIKVNRNGQCIGQLKILSKIQDRNNFWI